MGRRDHDTVARPHDLKSIDSIGGEPLPAREREPALDVRLGVRMNDDLEPQPFELFHDPKQARDTVDAPIEIGPPRRPTPSRSWLRPLGESPLGESPLGKSPLGESPLGEVSSTHDELTVGRPAISVRSMPKRVLITGGAGFLGSHLCERVAAEGHEVVCLDNLFTGRRENIMPLLDQHGVEFVRHDVTDPVVIDVDEVYHLACPASPVHYQRNPVRTIRTAVEGTLNMLELAREVGARILIASTSEIYGDPEVHPQPEGYWGRVNPIGPRACYDEGKRCAEALAVSYARQYGVEVRIARIFNTYGPRLYEDDGRVVSNFILQALRGKPITVYGDGSQTRSFCYVDDTIDGLVRLMAGDCGSVPVNIGSQFEFTMLELAQLVIELTASESQIVHAPLPADDPRQRRADGSRAKELLGWEPRVELRDGLSRTISYFRQRLERAAGGHTG